MLRLYYSCPFLTEQCQIAATVVSRYSNAKVETRIGKQGYAPEEQIMRGKVSPASDLLLSVPQQLPC